jgi:hypothetical protein
MHIISINTGFDGIFYPPLPLKSQIYLILRTYDIIFCEGRDTAVM